MSELQNLMYHLTSPYLCFRRTDKGKWIAKIDFFPTLTSQVSELITEEAYSFDGAVDILTQTLKEYVKENYQ